MQHPLTWFLDRINQTIYRGTTEIVIIDARMAQKLYELQSTTYTFSAPVRVHVAPQEG